MYLNDFTRKWKHRLRILQRLLLKYFYKSLGKLNTRLQPRQLFAIKTGYHHAHNAENFIDTSNTDEWQKEVYQLAASFMDQQNYHRVIDVGCGSAFKLMKYLGMFETIGVEVQPVHNWLMKTYPSKKWLLAGEIRGTLTTDLVMCSDVIEHLLNPDELIRFIRSIQAKHLLISTPERCTVAGKNDYGPPENTSHYREWNLEEFSSYLGKWFNIEKQEIFSGRSASQVVICSLKKRGQDRHPAPL